MKKTILFAAVLVAMTACNKTIIETPMADYGYISLGVSADTEMVATKAISTDAELAGYTITLINLINTDKTQTVWSKVYGTDEFADADWKVPAGNYMVTVTNHTDDFYSQNDGKGAVRVYGESTVAVTAGTTKDCTVACVPVNSMVSFAADKSFTDVFSSYSVTVVESDDRSVDMTIGSAHESANAAYFEPGTLTWILTATPKLGSESIYTKTFTATAAKWTQMTFSSNNADGQISVVTITVDNTIDAEDADPKVEIVDPFADAQ